VFNGAARPAIRSLRTGIVPAAAVQLISVGYSRFRSNLSAGLKGFLSGISQKPIFIEGEWGTGKSHTLIYCQSVAASAGLPTCLVSLNARSVPLNHPQRIYGEIAASIRIGSMLGIRPLLHSVLTDPAWRSRLRQHVSSGQAGVLTWPLSLLLDHYERNDILNPRLEFAWSFLLGEDLGWADYTYKRDQALGRIESLGESLRAVNGAGLIALFDEVETIDQLWNYRSRMVAYSVISRLSGMRSIWPLFAITDRFTRLARADYGRATPEAFAFLESITSSKLALFQTPQLDHQRAWRLAIAVANLYKEAHPSVRFSESQVDSWVGEWGRNPSRNPRRLIRLVVNRLDLSRPLS
jgi:bacteriophage exclusion system BrxC/D-like protein